MAINNFKPFAINSNANVTNQNDWEMLSVLNTGFQSGKASSAQINKALRQATVLSSTIGQFIANSGIDALDDGNISELVTRFTEALTTNLGLGSAATRSVGNGEDQIPDMSFFASGPGWVKFPDGTIIQRGVSIAGPVGYPKTIPLPIAFTQGNFTITTAFDSAKNISSDCPAFAATPTGITTFCLMSSRFNSSSEAGAYWIAIGK